MSIFANRPNTALLVIDVQNGVVDGAHQRDAVVANIRALVERARRAGEPVVWVQQTDENFKAGSKSWQIVPELEPNEGEPRVEKAYGDAFEQTALESILAELDVGSLLVTGAQTDQCIRCTLHGGLVRGYDVTLVKDAHTTEDNSGYGAPPPDAVIEHTNLYWTYETAPGRSAGTLASAEVEFGEAG